MRRYLVLVSLGAAFALAGCGEPPQAPEPAESALLDIPRPDPATMQGDVAELLEERWQALEAVRLATDSSAQELAEAYARFGLASFGNGLVIPAEAAFENAIHLVPGDARWVYFLALVREYNGDLEPAATGLQQVLALRPDDVPALLHLGDVRFEQARLADARDAYQRALAADAESAAAQYGLGRVASAQGDDSMAVQHFNAALRLQPEADRLNYLLGLAWRNLGDTDKARGYLEKRGNVEPSFEDPLFDEISGGQARVGGLWTDMNEGSQAYVDGDFERAVEKFRLATENHPDDPRSWQSLGMALRVIGDWPAADEAYKRALELNADNAGLHHDIGLLMLARGRPTDAAKSFTMATQLDPQKLESHVALARLAVGAGELQDALAHFDAALALDPQSVQLAMDRAELLSALGRPDDALEGLAGAVRANERDATLRMAYGLMLATSGRSDAAIAEIERSLDLAADDETRARGQYALGRAQLVDGDANAATAAFEQAVTLDADHHEARQELARTQVRSRNFEAALAQYRELLDRQPGNDGVRIEAAGAAVLMRQPVVARQLLEDGAQAEGASARLLSATARLMAAARNPEVRDPERALDYAITAFERSSTIANGETLALCLAAVGRFAEAIELQEQLLADVEQRGDEATIARITGNLQQLRGGRMARLPLDSS